MNCGSVESLKVSTLCGCSENACQIRCTVEADTPDTLAISRVLQCVAFVGCVSSVFVTICSMRSSPILRGAPQRGSSERPPRRCRANLPRQDCTVLRVAPTDLAMALLPYPNAG